jgi:hypothetical protein
MRPQAHLFKSKVRDDQGLIIRVTRGEHSGELRHFHFAAFLCARLLEGTPVTDVLDGALAIELLLHTPQRALDGFAFF